VLTSRGRRMGNRRTVSNFCCSLRAVPPSLPWTHTSPMSDRFLYPRPRSPRITRNDGRTGPCRVRRGRGPTRSPAPFLLTVNSADQIFRGPSPPSPPLEFHGAKWQASLYRAHARLCQIWPMASRHREREGLTCLSCWMFRLKKKC
jgi:hypothetical protein